jgi:hypothetical protein
MNKKKNYFFKDLSEDIIQDDIQINGFKMFW